MMENILIPLISFLTAMGFGGILGAYFQSLFQRKNEIIEKEHELKYKRYACILILMLTKLNFRYGLKQVQRIRPDLKSLEDINRELEIEFWNSFLYASDEVMKAISRFLMTPNHMSYMTTAAKMKRDLWGKRIQFKAETIVNLGKIIYKEAHIKK